jgi:hypothetical protein
MAETKQGPMSPVLKKRKRFGPEDREELVQKRLKTLNEVIEKEGKYAGKFISKLVSIEDKNEDMIEELQKRIEELQKRIDEVKKQADIEKEQLSESSIHRAFKRHSDAIEARHLLDVFQEHSLQGNPRRALLWSYDALYDHSSYGTRFYQIIQDVFGGVIPLRGVLPVEDSTGEWKYSKESTGDTLRCFEGGLHLFRKDLLDWEVVAEYLPDFEEFFPDHKRSSDPNSIAMQEVLQTCKDKSKWIENTTDSNDKWLPLRCFLLTTAKDSRKIRLKPFKEPSLFTSLLKWG